MPTLNRRQWEQEHGIDSLKGTKTTKSKTKSPIQDHTALQASQSGELIADSVTLELRALFASTQERAPSAAAKSSTKAKSKAQGAAEKSVLASGAKVFDIKALSGLSTQALQALLEEPLALRYLPSAQAISKEIDSIQKEMLALVHELKFEEAAILRDRMRTLEKVLLLMPGRELSDNTYE